MSIGGLSDIEKWESIWADASIITAMCVRAGKMGSVSGLGRQLLLIIDILRANCSGFAGRISVSVSGVGSEGHSTA